jgi:hypothetical protein
MSQISPPVRVLLAATLLFGVVWILFLKPGGATPVATTEATATAAATAATTAIGTSAASSTATTSSATGSAGGAAASAHTIASSRLPAAVKRALAEHDVVVLSFWNPRAADDRAVRRELSHVRKRPGKVFMRSVPVSRVAAYQGIARGVDLKQSPTVVVIDGSLQATTLVGYVDHLTIDQAIRDALRVR